MFNVKQFDSLWLIAYTVLVGAIIAGGYFFFFASSEERSNTVTVKRGDLVHEVIITGTVVPTSRIDVSFARTGRVTFVGFEVGDRVFRGNLLASLDTVETRTELALARSAFVAAGLTRRGQTHRNERTQITSLEADLHDSLMYAPIDGVITQRTVEEGEIVSANTPVITIVSDTAFAVTATVSKQHRANLAVGNEALVTLDGYDTREVFHAVLEEIDPAEPTVAGVSASEVVLRFTKYDPRIRPGMTAQVTVVTDLREAVLFVPSYVITRVGSTSAVRVLRGQEVETVEVETGLRATNGKVEIISGLQEGDKLVAF